MAWATPKTNWKAGDNPSSADFNRIEGNTADLDARVFRATAVLPETDWIGSEAPYSRSITVPGLLATDSPIVDLVPSTTWATLLTEEEAWGAIKRVVAGTNSLVFYAAEVPLVSLDIKVEVHR